MSSEDESDSSSESSENEKKRKEVPTGNDCESEEKVEAENTFDSSRKGTPKIVKTIPFHLKGCCILFRIFQISIAFVTFCCLCCIVIAIALSLSIPLYRSYESNAEDETESQKEEAISLKYESIKSQASSSLVKELRSAENMAKGLKGFVFTTTETMTLDTYTEYVTESGLLGSVYLKDTRWVVDVPHANEEYWRQEYTYSLGLSEEHRAILNETEFDPSHAHHYMACMTVPYNFRVHGTDFSEDSFYSSILEEALENNEPKYYLDYLSKSFEFILPVNLTLHSMNNSRIVNSIVWVKYTANELSEVAFDDYDDEVLFAVYDEEGKCVVSTCAGPASTDPDPFNPTGGSADLNWNEIPLSLSMNPREVFFEEANTTDTTLIDIEVSKSRTISYYVCGGVIVLLMLTVAFLCSCIFACCVTSTFCCDFCLDCSKLFGGNEAMSMKTATTGDLKSAYKTSKGDGSGGNENVVETSFSSGYRVMTFEEKWKMIKKDNTTNAPSSKKKTKTIVEIASCDTEKNRQEESEEKSETSDDEEDYTTNEKRDDYVEDV